MPVSTTGATTAPASFGGFLGSLFQGTGESALHLGPAFTMAGAAGDIGSGAAPTEPNVAGGRFQTTSLADVPLAGGVGAGPGPADIGPQAAGAGGGAGLQESAGAVGGGAGLKEGAGAGLKEAAPAVAPKAAGEGLSSTAVLAGATAGSGLLQGILNLEAEKRRLAMERAKFDIKQREQRFRQELAAREAIMAQPERERQAETQALQQLTAALGRTI